MRGYKVPPTILTSHFVKRKNRTKVLSQNAVRAMSYTIYNMAKENADVFNHSKIVYGISHRCKYRKLRHVLSIFPMLAKCVATMIACTFPMSTVTHSKERHRLHRTIFLHMRCLLSDQVCHRRTSRPSMLILLFENTHVLMIRDF